MLRILDAIVGGAHRINSISGIVFEFVKFNLLRPTLSWVRYASPVGSCIRKTDFGRGQILDSSFVLKAAIEGESLISGSSLFHSDKQ